MKKTPTSYPTSVRLKPAQRALVQKLAMQTGWSTSTTILWMLDLAQAAMRSKPQPDLATWLNHLSAVSTLHHRQAAQKEELAKMAATVKNTEEQLPALTATTNRV
jgi:aerobic-type carbon monoxide dehydrogenase small subunit (CoxS/CutS family)